MRALKTARVQRGLSQRALAKEAGVSYKTIQLLEEEGHDPKLSTLTHIAKALGYSSDTVARNITAVFLQPPDSLASVSERILEQGKASWKVWLFNFVDAFRSAKNKNEYVQNPPNPQTPSPVRELLASVAEALCAEANMEPPDWTEGISALVIPWFPAEVENLKAMALVESPVYFRRRNIFVLGNFLERK